MPDQVGVPALAGNAALTHAVHAASPAAAPTTESDSDFALQTAIADLNVRMQMTPVVPVHSRPHPGHVSPPVARQAAFTEIAFRSLIRSQFVSVHDRVAKALREAQVPTFDRAPTVAEAWIYGLYATILSRLPDRDGLRLHSDALRDGATPQMIARRLVGSAEGQQKGAIEAPDLDEVFVVGAYLVVLGRAPEASGMSAHAGLLSEGTATPAEVLGMLMDSGEARTTPRFPPLPIPRIRLLAEALQVVLLSREPEDQLTRALCLEGTWLGTRRMARLLLRRDRRLRGMIRSLFVSRSIARAVEIEATARGAYLEALANRQWQWRLSRSSFDRQAAIAHSIRHALVAAPGEISIPTSDAQ